jgi:hypothetical protein
MAPKAKSRKKVSKKSPKVAKPKLPSLIDRLPKTEEEYLEMLIRMDERHIDGTGSSLDQFFTNQRNRTAAKLAALRAAK